MIKVHSTLVKLAQQELNRREISGFVIEVRLVSYQGYPMLRIGFITNITPIPVLSAYEKLEHKDDEYYFYCPIDVSIMIE